MVALGCLGGTSWSSDTPCSRCFVVGELAQSELRPPAGRFRSVTSRVADERFPDSDPSGDLGAGNEELLKISSLGDLRDCESTARDRLSCRDDATRSRSFGIGGDDLREVDAEFNTEAWPEGARLPGDAARLLAWEPALGECPPRYGLLERACGRPYGSRSLVLSLGGGDISGRLPGDDIDGRSLRGDLGAYEALELSPRPLCDWS